MNDKPNGESLPAIAAAPLDPMTMLNAAVERGASLEVLSKLMDLQERWESNHARKSYEDAIAAARAEIKPIPKNREGHNGRKYADMAGIASTIDPIIASYGLSYRFRTKQDANRILVTCIVSHRAGYSEESELWGPADTSGSKNPIQSVGSTVTYLMRYSLTLALGLSFEENPDEDDGESAPRVVNGWPRGDLQKKDDYADGTPHKETKKAANGGKPEPVNKSRQEYADLRAEAEALIERGVSPQEFEAWGKENSHRQNKLAKEWFDEMNRYWLEAVGRVHDNWIAAHPPVDDGKAEEGSASRPTDDPGEMPEFLKRPISDRAIEARERSVPRLQKQPPTEMARIMTSAPHGETFDEPAWLNLLTWQYENAKTTQALAQIKEQVLLPAKEKAGKGTWEKACAMHRAAIERVTKETNDILRV